MKKIFSLILALLLLLLLCSCTENMEASGDILKKEIAFSAQYVRTDGFHEEEHYPQVQVITSKDELDRYYREHKELYQLDRAEELNFRTACKRYGDHYFEKQILLMVLLEEPSGSNRHRVLEITEENNQLTVEIQRILPESGDDDMALWHLLIEPDAGVGVMDEEAVTILLDGKNVTEKTVLAENSSGFANMRLPIPEGWAFDLTEQEGDRIFGIRFWPAAQTEGKVSIYYYDRFGLCGTGLESEEISLGRYTATKGTYDNNPVWSHIILNDVPGYYVIYNTGSKSWWNTYGEKAMEILDELDVAEGCLDESRTLPVAKKMCTIQYETVSSKFNYKNGDWNFTFYAKDRKETQRITVHPDGSVN